MATIIIKIGLTILALTAACPNTRAPTIPIVGPIGEGTLRPASRISSKEISITKISKIIGKGTFSREAKIENSNSVGSNSWWQVATAPYKPGRSKVIKIASKRKNLIKFANWNFKLVSSGEVIKSIKVAGIIKA